MNQMFKLLEPCEGSMLEGAPIHGNPLKQFQKFLRARSKVAPALKIPQPAFDFVEGHAITSGYLRRLPKLRCSSEMLSETISAISRI
jgi:hypothetical protein